MHELSLAINVVKIVEKEAKLAKAKAVTSVTLEIGECAGIDQNSFDFSWPFAVKDTVLENADRIVENVKAKGICLNCSVEFFMKKTFDPCPSCGSFYHDIIEGNNMKVKSMAII